MNLHNNVMDESSIALPWYGLSMGLSSITLLSKLSSLDRKFVIFEGARKGDDLVTPKKSHEGPIRALKRFSMVL